MRRITHLAMAIACASAAFLVTALYLKGSEARAAPAAQDPKLFEGLGNYRRAVPELEPEVRRWFDQGLQLTYGFNHQAAGRAFLKAAELDPDCAICWWGAALVLGPHVNSAMEPAAAPEAWRRLGKAIALAPGVAPVERALIEALAMRYAENPPADRAPLDRAYADAMGKLVTRFPDDLDIATLYAESLMNLQPWDYWDAAFRPKGETGRIVATLESVIARNADHPGALHLYIHAVEASADPRRGVAAADRLRELVPAAGHLVHMPAHIYARVGRWRDAAIANHKAIGADDAYLALCRPTPGLYSLGYVPHNHHFLWFAASMSGDRATALQAAAATAERVNIPEVLAAPGYEAMQNFWMTPLFAQVRFGEWQALSARAAPPANLRYAMAVWHYGQAMAATRLSKPETAQLHLDALRAALADPAIGAMLVFGRYPLTDGLAVAVKVVEGELAALRKDYAAAVAALTEGTRLEDALPYDEPPAWHAPVRHNLGAVLLEAGRAAEAEAVYRADLQRHPDNGWSLFGLQRALAAQGRTAEATQAEAAFRKGWSGADLRLGASRL